jgi:hypothetical protein
MEFEVTIGSAEYQVSLHMHLDRLSKTITADQTRCILHIITKFELADAHPVIPPSDANVKLSEVRNDNEEVEEDFPHQQPVGSLMFAMIGSRPDISYALSMVTKFS